MKTNTIRQTAVWAGLVTIWLALPAQARPWRPGQLPKGVVNGQQFSCSTCHISPAGGGTRNIFGKSVETRLQQLYGSAVAQPKTFWDAVLASQDADGDGFTNGEELGDPNGDGITIDLPVTRPGDTNSKPASVTQPLQLLGIKTTDTNTLALNWDGGAGPFILQKKSSFAIGPWHTLSSSTNRDALAPNDSAAGFYSVNDASQIAPVQFTAYLSGAGEKPDAVVTSGAGAGIFILNKYTLTFEIHYQNLSGPAAAAHIHGAAGADETAGVMIDLKSFAAGPLDTNGVLKGSIDLTSSQRAALLGGKTYANVHTAAHGAGEIRGQIVPVHMEVALNGDASRPNPVTTAGHGTGLFSLLGNRLSFHIEYDGLSGPATAAHIHGPGGPEAQAAVMLDLAPFAEGALDTFGTIEGSANLTSDQLLAVLSGKTYVNVHTAANPGGEIRGQVVSQVVGVPYSVYPDGASEKPNATTSSGSGFGHFTVEGDTLRFEVHYRGLSGPPVAAHLHGPADATQTAPPILDLTPSIAVPAGTNGFLIGALPLTDPTVKAAILSGQTYFNIHTASNPGGEIRSQVAPVVYSATLNGANERPIAVTTAANGLGVFSLVGDVLSFSVLYNSLTGNASAAHIHGPATVDETASPLIDLAGASVGPFSPSGAIAGSEDASPGVIQALAGNKAYINLHTAANGGGEIRGQILRR